MGIEPTCPAWKAGVLPLNYTRIKKIWICRATNDILTYRVDLVKKKLFFFASLLQAGDSLANKQELRKKNTGAK